MTASAKGADVEQWANSAEWRNSAKGAEYDSQGQARSKAERVAPGHEPNPKKLGLKGRNISRRITPFQGYAPIFIYVPGATHSASLRACPWLSYSAPLALLCPRPSYSASLARLWHIATWIAGACNQTGTSGVLNIGSGSLQIARKEPDYFLLEGEKR